MVPLSMHRTVMELLLTKCVTDLCVRCCKLNVHDIPAKAICVIIKVIHDMPGTSQQKENYLSGFQSTMAFPLVTCTPICVRCASVRLRVALVAASVARQRRGTEIRTQPKGRFQTATPVAALRRSRAPALVPRSAPRGSALRRSRGPCAGA